MEEVCLEATIGLCPLLTLCVKSLEVICLACDHMDLHFKYGSSHTLVVK